MKKSLVAVLMIITLMIVSSCGNKTKGNPDLDNRSEWGIMYPIDSEGHCVSRVCFSTSFEGSKIWYKDDELCMYCYLTEKSVKKYGWRQKQLDMEEIDNPLEVSIIRRNDNYEWNEKDVLCKAEGEFKCFVRGSNQLSYKMDFIISLPDSMTDDPGEYTLIFYTPDGEIDSMYDFETFPKSELSEIEQVYKPVIYLYPEEDTDVTVDLDFDGEFTCTYPSYNDGWEVTAEPDGRLFDHASERYYDYLFWEGTTGIPDDFDEAIVVPGDETAIFLEEYLSLSGLNDSEIDDFITFWLPKMQDNPYNLISFPTEEYEQIAKLDVAPAPDTMIRVYMVFKPLDEYLEIADDHKLQMPTGVERSGFTVVEWGGSIVE